MMEVFLKKCRNNGERGEGKIFLGIFWGGEERGKVEGGK